MKSIYDASSQSSLQFQANCQLQTCNYTSESRRKKSSSITKFSINIGSFEKKIESNVLVSVDFSSLSFSTTRQKRYYDKKPKMVQWTEASPSDRPLLDHFLALFGLTLYSTLCYYRPFEQRDSFPCSSHFSSTFFIFGFRTIMYFILLREKVAIFICIHIYLVIETFFFNFKKKNYRQTHKMDYMLFAL